MVTAYAILGAKLVLRIVDSYFLYASTLVKPSLNFVANSFWNLED